MIRSEFITTVVNLEKLQEFSFIIPTYQRPYVWRDEEIAKLLKDFYLCYKAPLAEDYFIGTILTKENGLAAELIDGQQRFTTLWLTAFVFDQKGINTKLKTFLKNSDRALRLTFEIRTEVEDYFNMLLSRDKSEAVKVIESGAMATFPYLKNIAKGLVTIGGIIDTFNEDDLPKFGDYIFQQVYFIKNTTPPKIDLNKLFSTINSAGLQLEQTDIIKANLLKRVEEKVIFGKIWEVCENMDDYFERNIRASFPVDDWTDVDMSQFVPFTKELFLSGYEDVLSNVNPPTFTINQLHEGNLDHETEIGDKKADENNRPSDEIYCRSIITFGQLLLHTYQLHLKEENRPNFEGTFHVNRLIEIFKSLEDRNDQSEIKRFFLLLWKVRFLFDKYVVKWITDTDTKTEHLELMNVTKNSDDKYYSRRKYDKRDMLMLQSMLYFTGDYLRQYWLTPYLGYLLENHKNLPGNSDDHLLKLEDLDNQLSLCNSLSNKDASFKLLDSKLQSDIDFKTYLLGEDGTKFQHYWFQKLEYVLWKNWSRVDKSIEFNNYRISSKNSVEHIYPQDPENKKKNPRIDNCFLHSFGNLVLLNVSQNSEYSNKSVDEKRSIFNNKNNTFDTLKSYYIFRDYDKWEAEEIDSHRVKMLGFLEKHYQII